MRLYPLLGLLFAAVPAGAEPEPCVSDFQAVCAQNVHQWPDVIRRTETGGLFLNPKLPPRVMVELAGLKSNETNVSQEFQPLFDALQRTLVEMIDETEMDWKTKDRMRRTAESLVLYIEQRARCKDLSRPFVAGSGAGTTLCPFTTNMAPETVYTMIAHELAHFTDPCGKAGWPALNDVGVERVQDCKSDDELYADRFGARLAGRTLPRLPGLRALYMSLPKDQRFAALTYYRLMETPCQVRAESVSAFFESEPLRALLECSQ